MAQSNYRSAPIGGRSQLLGGTGMTYARDAAAAFLNPATAVLVDDRRLSFSVNFYTMSFVYAPRWYQPGPIDRSKFGNLSIDDAVMTDLEFAALPSSLCLFFRAGDIPRLAIAAKSKRTREARIGFCFATVQDQEFNFAAEGFNATAGSSVTRQAQTLSQSYTRFSAGPTYAMHVSNAVAIGASLHASLASHRSLLAASATTYGAAGSPINSTFYSGSRGDSFQLDATMGVTYRLGKQTLGLSIRSPSVHIFGVGGANRQEHFDGTGNNFTSIRSETGSFVSRSPARLGLGTGLEGSWGQAELNMTYFTPLGASYTAEIDGNVIDTLDAQVNDRTVAETLREPARGVVNLAAGAEVFMNEKISLLGGVATDFSAVQEGALRGNLMNYYPYRTHRITGAFGLGAHSSEGEVLIGGELSVGWGDRLAVNSYQLPPVIGTTGHGTYQLMLVFAGSTSLRAIRAAVQDVQNVLKDPKKQQPAAPK